MAVQRRAQALLVKVVTNETDTTPKDEKTVQGTNLNVFVGFFSREGAAVPEQVDEANSDTTVNVEDKL